MHSIEHFFLAFSHETILLPVIVLGFIWVDRTIFYHAVCLLLLSMLFNYVLKISFQVPLSKQIGQGFAFPSGHMQQSTVFYGWLAYKIPSTLLRLLIMALLLGIAYSLTQRGYHQWGDIAGAVVAAVLLLGAYVISKRRFSAMPGISLVTATLFLVYIQWRGYQIPPASWMAYYALLGFIIAAYFSKQLPTDSKKRPIHITQHAMQKCLATAIALVGIVVIRYFFRHWVSTPHKPLAYVTELQWFFIGLIIPYTCFFAEKCSHCKK